MNIFEMEETLCQREGNRCKQRKKCKRYLAKDRDGRWEADYWKEFMELCDYFVKEKKEK